MMDAIAVFVQALGVPLALVGLWLSMRNSAKSQDVQVILSFAESFREKWEGGWADLLSRVEVSGCTPGDEKELRYLLNWIDWVGSLAAKGGLRQEEVIITSLHSALSRAILAGQPILDADEALGPNHWAGVLFVKKRLRGV